LHNVRILYKPRWSGPASIQDVLRVSGPLIISQFSVILNLFFDRLFLSWYDLEVHMPASMSAGVAWWASIIFFIGIISYLTTFVAQYFGADRNDRIGSSIWQTIYLALIFSVLIWATFPILMMIFKIFGGENSAQYVQLQIEYCFILNLGIVPLLFNTAISGVFSSMDRLKSVIFVSFMMTFFNVLLNQRFIFNPPEWLPFIEEGLSGAAWGTMFSVVAGSFFYLYLLVRRGFYKKIELQHTWRFDKELFFRIIKFGVPQGIHHFVEVSGFALLMLVMGSISPIALGAANIAFTVNNMVFVPLMSMGQAVGILVGQYIGARKIEESKRIASTGMFIGASMVSLIALSYVVFPDFYINIFHAEGTDPEIFAAIAKEARIYLIFIATYAFADVFGLIYSGALRGAGDTKYCMYVSAICSVLFLVIPNLMAWYFGWPAIFLFVNITFYIFILTGIYLVRYVRGKWTTMTVMGDDLTTKEVATIEGTAEASPS